MRPGQRLRREVRGVIRAETPTHAHLRSRIATLTLAAVVADAVGSVLMLLADRHEPRSDITNIGDALFWTTSQLLTVSSQMTNPLSTWGRILDVGLELLAITLVTALAGSFGAFFLRRGHERDAEGD